jgi:hypothetical protein
MPIKELELVSINDNEDGTAEVTGGRKGDGYF